MKSHSSHSPLTRFHFTAYSYSKARMSVGAGRLQEAQALCMVDHSRYFGSRWLVSQSMKASPQRKAIQSAPFDTRSLASWPTGLKNWHAIGRSADCRKPMLYSWLGIHDGDASIGIQISTSVIGGVRFLSPLSALCLEAWIFAHRCQIL